MKEPNELNEVLAKAVEKGIEVTEKTGQFIIDQAPDLLQEFYRWHIAKGILGIIFAIVLFMIGRYLPYMWLDKSEDYNDVKFFSRWGDEGGFGAWVLFCITSLISLIVIIEKIYNLAFILSSPKLYLIEYFLNK